MRMCVKKSWPITARNRCNKFTRLLLFRELNSKLKIPKIRPHHSLRPYALIMLD